MYTLQRKADFFGVRHHNILSIDDGAIIQVGGGQTIEPYPVNHKLGVTLTEEHYQIIIGENNSQAISYKKGFQINIHPNITAGSHVIDPDDMPIVPVTDLYRTLQIVLRSQEISPNGVWVPNATINAYDCLYIHGVGRVLSGDPDEDLLSRSLDMVVLLLGSDNAGYRELETLRHLPLPNLDRTIQACIDFGYAVDTPAIESEIQNGHLGRTHLIDRILGK